MQSWANFVAGQRDANVIAIKRRVRAPLRRA